MIKALLEIISYGNSTAYLQGQTTIKEKAERDA